MIDMDNPVSIRSYCAQDLPDMISIWNEIVKEGIAFPQEDCLSERDAEAFFSSQSYCGVAQNKLTGEICGLYILHPNNIGRCSHICNASYAVNSRYRGMRIGEKLVLDSMKQGKELGFRILQFNAVVSSNTHARHLYERLGFIQLGTIVGGFRMNNHTYSDICPYYRILS